MTTQNEAIVEKIRNGISVAENMLVLYESNLPLIKKLIKPYAVYGGEEDCLQESYFGLWEAVRHYETDRNVKFMTFAQYYILSAVRKYLEKCGSTVRIPRHMRQKMACYKKTAQEMEQELGREPADHEIADRIRMPVEVLQELKEQMSGVASLDTPLPGCDDLTLADTLKADFSLEEDAVDKIYAGHSKSELWGIVERFAGGMESVILKEIFVNRKTMAQVARELGLKLEWVRQIKARGLRRLRMGKARRELRRKFDIADSALYRGGYASYDERYFTSIVEHIAVKRMEAEERYMRHVAEVEEMHRNRIQTAQRLHTGG